MRFFSMLLIVLMSSMAMAKTVLKISTLYPPGSEVVTSLQALGQSLSVQTNGEVTLKVYPGGVMGNDTTVMRKIRIGQLQGALLSGSGLDLITDDLKDLSQPFQFNSLEDVYAMRIDIDGEFLERLANEGWVGFGPLDGGFSYLMSKLPIADMDELRSAKLWLPNTSDIQALSKEMDLNYRVMGIGDVLTGLDTGAIDTLVSPPSAALTLNWYSRVKYYTDKPVIYTFGMLVLPEKALKRVPQVHDQIVRDALSDWAETQDANMRESNASAFMALQQLLRSQPFNLGKLPDVQVSTK